MIARLRRMADEPMPQESGVEPVYSDEVLAEYIEAYPLPDLDGNLPDLDTWTPTYDLNAAAADVWEEKAAALARRHDFSADGGRFNRSQQYEQALKQARHYRSRRAVRMLSVVRGNKPGASYIANETEAED